MKKCPKCQSEMIEDCYLNDSAQTLSHFVVVQKDEDLKKKRYPVKVVMCKECGYLEFYASLDKKD